MSRKLMNLRAKFTMLLLALVWSVSAQTFTITGEVSDENGEPIIGANVMIQNTNMGTSTDLDGNKHILINYPLLERIDKSPQPRCGSSREFPRVALLRRFGFLPGIGNGA